MSLKRHDRGTVQTDGPGTGAHRCSASMILPSQVRAGTLKPVSFEWVRKVRRTCGCRLRRCASLRRVLRGLA